MKSTISKCLGVLLAIALFMALTTPANALPMLRYTSVAVPGQITITDGLAGDSLPVPGGVTILGPTLVGGWQINSGTALTQPILGTPVTPEMQLLSNVTSLAPGILTIEWTETGFLPTNPFTAIMEFGGNADAGTLLYEAFWGADNAPFSISGGLIDTLGPFVGPVYSGTETSGVFSPAGPFSLTQRITLFSPSAFQTFGIGGAHLALSPATAPVPEPSTFILLGAGLAGLAVWRKKRS